MTNRSAEPPRAFISYRAEDSLALATSLTLELNRVLAWGNVFLDHRDLEPGEAWPARLRAEVQRSDVVLVLIGPRWLSATSPDGGRRLDDPTDWVRQEIEVALTAKRNIVPVLIDNTAPLDARVLQTTPHLAPLADIQAISFVTRHWNTAFEQLLGALIARGFESVRPTQATRIFLTNLPATFGEFFGREAELDALSTAWRSPERSIVMLTGWGGVGKTSVVNHWLDAMQRDGWRDARRVYAWSFYSQGTREDSQSSGNSFITHALRWFGDRDPSQGSYWDQGERLANLIRREPTLLILDGLEPLQHPPGAMHGRLRDQAVEALVKNIARGMNGLCVITTRLPVHELTRRDSPALRELALEELSTTDGVALLRKLGVTKGTHGELADAVGEFRGHALSLMLLGRYLNVVHGGDIAARRHLGPLHIDDAQYSHAAHVLAGYRKWLKGKPELQILHLLGLFDRIADAQAIAMLRRRPAIHELTDLVCDLSDAEWQFAVQHLRELRLLAERRTDAPSEALDCHPLVREYFSVAVKSKLPVAWVEGHRRLFRHFQDRPVAEYGTFLPETAEQMESLFRAIAHGCQAGEYERALRDVYWERVNRRARGYSYRHLGLFDEDLQALANFFDIHWTIPNAGLSETSRALVLGLAGSRLRATGRIREAIEPSELACAAYAERGEWALAARQARHLGEIYLVCGPLTKAAESTRIAVELAERSGSPYEQFVELAVHATVLHHLGQRESAIDAFERSERILVKATERQMDCLYSLWGFRYCDCLLDEIGEVPRVSVRVEKMRGFYERGLPQKDEEGGLDRAARALVDLLAARVAFLKARMAVPPGPELERAKSLVRTAVAALKAGGRQDYRPLGLFTLAAVCREAGVLSPADDESWDEAQRSLETAFEISERGGMKLHETDCHLEFAKLALARYAVDQKAERLALARTCLTNAATLATQIGYRRRSPEMAQLRMQWT